MSCTARAGGGAREAAWRLVSAPLVSDMAAFKAANPGAVLQDFLAWHSPKDVPQSGDGAPKGHSPDGVHATSSTRMAACAVVQPAALAAAGGGASNPWHVLWDSTPACPAAEQKPLQVGMTQVFRDWD